MLAKYPRGFYGDASVKLPGADRGRIDRMAALLVRCRSVLRTAHSDAPNDLNNPSRKSVIERLITDIDGVLK